MMERSQPDSGIHGDDGDSIGSEQPSTAAYLEHMGVVPDVLPTNKHGRIRTSLATDTDKDMHDLIYCKLDDVIGDEDPSLVGAQYRQQRSRHTPQSSTIDTTPHIMPHNWGPKYQPLTQMFSEIKEMKHGHDTLRRMKQHQHMARDNAASPNIWVPNFEPGTPSGTLQHTPRTKPKVTVLRRDTDNNNELEIRI